MHLIRRRILRYYVTQTGKTPVLEWLRHLKSDVTRLRIKRRLDRLALGHFGDCAPVGEGVHELRLFFGSGYRIYFSEHDRDIIILLCAGDKSSQKKDIQLARSYWSELRGKSYE